MGVLDGTNWLLFSVMMSFIVEIALRGQLGAGLQPLGCAPALQRLV
jgi:hypothetical protein